MRYEDNICPNCFNSEYGNGECPGCGFLERYKPIDAPVLPVGTLLHNRYIVGKVLGVGGFGLTYKVCDLEKGIICALKEYAPSGTYNRMEDGITMAAESEKKNNVFKKGLQRFFTEAQILYKLGNVPAVVNILDYFKENDTAYFTMEFLDGANLNQIVRASGGRMPFDEVTGIITQVGKAMDTIHKKAFIFHRDISPENIYITKDKEVKLIDFGSAKVNAGDEKTGSLLTLKKNFAPPEQHGSSIPQGAYTDVFSLAATYYYALTGHNLPTAIERLTGAAYVPLNQMNMGIPDYISAAVDRALELDYQKRTQSMDEFIRGISKEYVVVQTHYKTERYPYLEVSAGQMMGSRWNLPVDMEIIVGRSRRESHIAIEGYQSVSKIHCTIYYDAKKNLFYIKDLSRNGTYVDGRKLEIHKLIPVRPSCSIALANETCMITLGVNLVQSNQVRGVIQR